MVDARVVSRVRIRPCLYAALLVSMIVVADAGGDGAQVAVPPAASLDIQVPIQPMPVRIDGRSHLAYELHITNYRSIDLSLASIDIIGEGSNRLARYGGEDLAARMARVGARANNSDARMLGAGARVIVFVWLAVDGEMPATLQHRISYQFAEPSDGAAIATVDTTALAVGRESPVVLATPLSDGPWAALYDPSMARGHRRSLFAIEGRARIPARFAVDWVKLGEDGRPYRGDRSVLTNHYAYGSEVFSVAEASVASAVDRFPEPTVPITLDNEAGNYIALDVGGGRFVFYEHLQPGSVRVKAGDRVHTGDLLARVGASGSVSSGPHLHFHVSDANSLLGAEGLPFVFRSFDVLGAFESLTAFASGQRWIPNGTPTSRRLEMPDGQAVIRFEVRR